MFSIAYDALTSNTAGTCSTDTAKPTNACATMTKIASESGKFYSDTSSGKSGCPSTQTSLANLVQVFQVIGQSLQAPRLLTNNTT